MGSVNNYTAPKIQVIWRMVSASSDTAKCASPFTRQPLHTGSFFRQNRLNNKRCKINWRPQAFMSKCSNSVPPQFPSRMDTQVFHWLSTAEVLHISHHWMSPTLHPDTSLLSASPHPDPPLTSSFLQLITTILISTIINNYYYYFHITARWTWASHFLRMSSSTCSGKEPLGNSGTGFIWAGCASCLY